MDQGTSRQRDNSAPSYFVFHHRPWQRWISAHVTSRPDRDCGGTIQPRLSSQHSPSQNPNLKPRIHDEISVRAHPLLASQFCHIISEKNHLLCSGWEKVVQSRRGKASKFSPFILTILGLTTVISPWNSSRVTRDVTTTGSPLENVSPRTRNESCETVTFVQ